MTQLNSLELDGNQITHVDPNAFIGLEGKRNFHAIPLTEPYATRNVIIISAVRHVPPV